MYGVGGISKTTIREFDGSCLETMESIKPAQIRLAATGERIATETLRVYHRN